jgi:hypothetical protein
MTDNSSTSARPRPYRLQFSLRLLLLAFTAFAIGFPIWYRWPYEETEEQRDSAGKLEFKRITTWQRQWGGQRLMHGEYRAISGDLTTTATFSGGEFHGPYALRDKKGRFSTTGQYVDNMKEGVWIETNGKASTTAHWLHDRLDGVAEITSQNGDKTIATFDAGRLTNYNGQTVDDRPVAALARRSLDKQIAEELERTTTIDFVEMPLKDVAIYLSETHQIPIALDPIRIENPDQPLSFALEGIHLRSALILLLAPHNLACDYRYGSLWITTADDVEDWHDSTGVSEIKPPKDSALARAWLDTGVIDAVEVPLAFVLADLEQKLLINIDATRIPFPTKQPMPREALLHVTLAMKGVPFQHILGRLLYQTRCRCRLEGETLVILPPDTESP